LEQYYYNLETRLRDRDSLFDKIQSEIVGISKAAVMNFLRRQYVHQLTYPTQRNTVIKPVVSDAPNKHWQVDLVDMSQFASPANHGVHYFLSVVDVFSKYLWVRTLPNKKAPTVLKAIQHVIQEARSMAKQPPLDLNNQSERSETLDEGKTSS
jgi:hypothetical protein